MRPISKRAARLAGITVGMFAVGCAMLWLWLGEPRGPLINGKPVAYWTRQLRGGHTDEDAISALASEKGVAIPVLVKQLSLPDSRISDVVKSLWRRLPATLRNMVPAPTTRAELRVGAAFALIKIYENDFAASLAEAHMMLPALTSALQDRDVRVRFCAAGSLGYLGVISAQAIEACDVALKDQHWFVRGNAVNSLGRLAKSDERAIPCLKSALSDSHLHVRKRAEEQLEILGIAPSQDDASSVIRE